MCSSSGVWPVCPAPSWLFYFTFCLWILTSPSYSHLLCLTSRFELLFLSLSLSFSPSLCLCLFDALIVGWMTEAIRLFHPHIYTELSCPVLRCEFSCTAYLKEKAECDSDAKVGGMGPGGWLNRLTLASQTHSLSQGRYSDKYQQHGKLETWTAFKCDLQFKDRCCYISRLFWRQTKALDLICWYDCYLLW